MFWEPCPKCGGPFIFLDDVDPRYACAACFFEAPESDLIFHVENGIITRIELKEPNVIEVQNG